MAKRTSDSHEPFQRTLDRELRGERTRVAPTWPRISPPGPEEALSLSYARMLDVASTATQPLYVVALVDPGAPTIRVATIAPGRSLTIGRHERCGLRFDAPDCALRIITALVLREGDGLRLRLWELRAGPPFRTSDGHSHRALESEGPVFVTYGRCALWFLPFDGRRPWPEKFSSAWRWVRGELAQADAEPGPSCNVERGACQGAARANVQPLWERTRVTPLRPPVDPNVAPDPTVFPYARVRVETPSVKGCWTLSLDDLARGILIGRYACCDLGQSLSATALSRVHLLLVQIEGEIWMIDTASTNGVRLGGQALDTGALDDGASLTLCPGVRVRLELIRYPEA